MISQVRTKNPDKPYCYFEKKGKLLMSGHAAFLLFLVRAAGVHEPSHDEWFHSFPDRTGRRFYPAVPDHQRYFLQKLSDFLNQAHKKKPVFQASRAIDCNRKQQITLDSSTIRAIYCYLLLSIALMALDG